MVPQTVLATLPGSGPHQRLQVALRQKADGRLVIELRDQHFGGEAIGWFDQRTMTLEPRQWQQLQAVLGAKGPSAALDAESESPPATIPFPGPNVPRPRRPAVGGRG